MFRRLFYQWKGKVTNAIIRSDADHGSSDESLCRRCRFTKNTRTGRRLVFRQRHCVGSAAGAGNAAAGRFLAGCELRRPEPWPLGAAPSPEPCGRACRGVPARQGERRRRRETARRGGESPRLLGGPGLHEPELVASEHRNSDGALFRDSAAGGRASFGGACGAETDSRPFRTRHDGAEPGLAGRHPASERGDF